MFPHGVVDTGLSMHKETRTACFRVLSLLPFPYKKHYVWSEARKKISWRYDPSEHTIQNNSGFVGLQNQGATCYMNSMLQQLYHIDTFRNGILRCLEKENEEESKDQLIGGPS